MIITENINRHKNIAKSLRLDSILSFFSVPFVTFYFMLRRFLYSLAHKRVPEQIDTYKDLGELTYEKVEFKSKRDNIKLKGLFFPANNASSKTLILVHGLSQDKLISGHTKKIVEYLTPKGYNILSFDLRCHGESYGSMITFGCHEKYDVMGAIDYLKSRGKVGEKIALLGFSMGAVSVIEAAEKDTRVDAVIADSPFRDLRLFVLNDIISSLSNYLRFLPDNIANSFYWPIFMNFPFKSSFISLVSRICSINLNEVSPMNAVKNISPKPIFIIHGRGDRLIPCTNSEAIFEPLSKNSNASLWLTDNAAHIESLNMYSNEYLKRVQNYLDENI